ncbi:hypothetical protein [Clostridium beijerinckii]|uniref:Uncharacterized protein n=1 Tax=Clostridium beijerinckii TaxID=1520 RepID=A0AAE5HBC2_CLOBE|nr:hypothetical protein [Clostridium beijerinckii]NSB17425.1 hypothetical protein [Clostridium beijerinckii]OOM28463.1 hypothetical protein CLOBE_27190 [Clostridium beijerinckii]
MALKMNYIKQVDKDMLKNVGFNYLAEKVEDSITFFDAYIKITNQNGDKNNINLVISIYNQKEGILLDQDSYSFIPDTSDTAVNFIKQGYQQIKANKYPTAIDLLDEGQTA